METEHRNWIITEVVPLVYHTGKVTSTWRSNRVLRNIHNRLGFGTQLSVDSLQEYIIGLNSSKCQPLCQREGTLARVYLLSRSVASRKVT